MLLEYRIKIKRLWDDWHKDIVVGATAFFISLASFSLGYLAAKQGSSPQIVISGASGVSKGGVIQSPEILGTASIVGSEVGRYVASRNGRYYYLPTCPGVNRIKEENKIWFQTREEAEGRGLRPAANCPGLE